MGNDGEALHIDSVTGELVSANDAARANETSVTGELVSHRVVGDDFYSIATLVERGADTGRRTIALTGKLIGASLGDTIQVDGSWSVHARYGRQFRVSNCAVLMPATDAGVVSWMAGRLRHLGRERAQSMLSHFGGPDGVWSAIENTPERLTEIKGITPARADEIVDAYARFVHDRDRVIRFKRWGLTDGQIAKVIAKWGDETEANLRDNPYQLTEHVAGFGFIKADKIAQRMGVPKDSPSRIQCGLQHRMTQAAGHGHMYVPSGKLVAMATKILHVDSSLVAKELKIMRKKGGLVQRGKQTFLRALDAFEQSCADRIVSMLGQRER